MKAAGKNYEPVTYDGAGHGFMRAGEDPGDKVPGNKTAREQGFARLVKLLHEMKAGTAANRPVEEDTVGKKSRTAAQLCHESAGTATGGAL